MGLTVLCGIFLVFRLNVKKILHNIVNPHISAMGLNNVMT